MHWRSRTQNKLFGCFGFLYFSRFRPPVSLKKFSIIIKFLVAPPSLVILSPCVELLDPEINTQIVSL